MEQPVQHRIQVRKFSSNVLERGIWVGDDKNGQPMFKWSVFVMPVVQSGEGSFVERKEAIDKLTEDLLYYFVEQEIKNQLDLDISK
jgi:phosphoenolpyruvate carboxylase